MPRFLDIPPPFSGNESFKLLTQISVLKMPFKNFCQWRSLVKKQKWGGTFSTMTRERERERERERIVRGGVTKIKPLLTLYFVNLCFAYLSLM
jgi:hypothetical protein